MRNARDDEREAFRILREHYAGSWTAGEIVSDALLVAMVLKGLPDDYRAFMAVINQSDTVQNFQK